MRRFLFTLVQLTWGLPQTLLGFIMYLYWLPRAKTRYVYHGAIVTEWTSGGGISLGLFVFVSDKARPSVTVHEYGHCIQSLLLGPLYLIAVGIPSYLWANLPALRKMRRETGRSYYSVYPENWANRLGEWSTGESIA
jgi:hypothetical protein